jgi:hypothetical protein
MRGSIVLTFIAVSLGSLWFQPGQGRHVIGLHADGTPFYESMFVAPGAVASTGTGAGATPSVHVTVPHFEH